MVIILRELKQMLYIDTPELWECEVYSVTSFHKTLFIKLKHTLNHQKATLYFPTPIFFNLPMKWIGASFELASEKEQVSLKQQLSVKSNINPSNLSNYQLFVCQSLFPKNKLLKYSVLSIDMRLKLDGNNESVF